MNPKLRHLLALSGVDDDLGREIRWSDVIVLQNYGAIPPAVEKSGHYVWNRGFNLLLLGQGGAPRYFCKCRPTADHNLERETAVLQALQRDSELRGLVPRARGARCGEVQLQVSEFRSGQSYEVTLPRVSRRNWAASMAEILTVARRLSTRATALLPHLLADPRPVVLHEAAGGALTELAAAGLGNSLLRLVNAGLQRAGPLPRMLQHGDLWPANVLRHQGTWRLLDFEIFGRIQVPLYDVCHFVRTCWSLREHGSEGATAWIDRVVLDARDAQPCRRMIRREARELGLTAPQAVGALLYYLVDIAAQFRRRGMPRRSWEPLVQEVRRAGEALAAGTSLEDVVWGGP